MRWSTIKGKTWETVREKKKTEAEEREGEEREREKGGGGGEDGEAWKERKKE